MSSQFWPLRASTIVGTLRVNAVSIVLLDQAARSSGSADSDTSRTSSSWTWRIIVAGSFNSRSCGIEIEHGLLDDVGLRSLDRHVHGHALGALTARAV